jgi:hypothetical protein
VVQVLEVNTTEVYVTNIGSATAYTAVVPANTLCGTGNTLRVTVDGLYLNNSGANRQFTWRMDINGVNALTSASGNNNAASATSSLNGIFYITATSTNSQFLSFFGATRAGNSAPAPVTGAGYSAADCTANMTIEVLFGHSTAADTLTAVKKVAIIELLPASPLSP